MSADSKNCLMTSSFPNYALTLVRGLSRKDNKWDATFMPRIHNALMRKEESSERIGSQEYENRSSLGQKKLVAMKIETVLKFWWNLCFKTTQLLRFESWAELTSTWRNRWKPSRKRRSDPPQWHHRRVQDKVRRCFAMVTWRLDINSGTVRRSEEKVSILLESKLFQPLPVSQSNSRTFQEMMLLILSCKTMCCYQKGLLSTSITGMQVKWIP